MKSDSGTEKLALAGLALVGLYVVFIGFGMLLNRIWCSGWALPDHPFSPVTGLSQGSMSGFGAPGGCAAPVAALGVGAVLLVVAAGALVVGGLISWRKYTQSDRYLLNDVSARDGIAKRPEIKAWVGAATAKRNVRTLRPQLVAEKGKRKVKPEDASFPLGRSKGVQCFESMEESSLLLGPPRSGKGRNVIVGKIIDAPGAVITTSSRADNYAMTRDLRAAGGRPVALFDPQGLTGVASTLKWSPITGCENPSNANARASSLVGAAGLDENSSNAEWAGPAVTVMECLLHAAALGGHSVDELMLWGSSPAAAKTAVKVLEEHPESAPGWAEALAGIIREDPKMRANKWFGAANSVKGLAVPNVRASMKPTSVEETFDIDRFIKESGTLYIIGTRTGGSSAGPFLIAMMDAITQRAREIAVQSEGNRLDPPLALILDEIANIASAWPALEQLMSDGGGVGIAPTAVFQSIGQIQSRWSHEAARVLWEAATVKLQLGGASDIEHLRTMEDLMDTREVTRTSTSRQSEGSSVSEQTIDKPVLSKAEIRRFPFGWGLLFFRKQRPIVIELRDYKSRKDADEISESKKNYATEIGVRAEAFTKEADFDGAFDSAVQQVADRAARESAGYARSAQATVDQLAAAGPSDPAAESTVSDPTAEPTSERAENRASDRAGEPAPIEYG
ncbi:type IV secretory system conjugative DNA transfer family protein [Nesterenkonia marinintestina]|uniref:type IV secretory system conjugative DNA transfer family protein n=1 Tax=Nesterenkonia marinintestina TaxID=2979865 RepID=UPI0021BE2D8C|nr:type IV secretory system conjugative DNA transfer family protein [Nesterenkonia sp. GX14115]